MQTKLDFKKTQPCYKAKRGQYSIVDVPAMQYLMIDGMGDPGTSADFAAAMESLYPVAYGLKFKSKLTLDKDYVVPPLEALWWAEDMAAFTEKYDRSQWLWTTMIMVPDWISEVMVAEVRETVEAKKNPASLHKLRLETLNENTCVQTLHLGSYSDEGPTLNTMHEEFIPDNGFEMAGKHHEIYFNDFRKVAPEKLRTVLRQPVTHLPS